MRTADRSMLNYFLDAVRNSPQQVESLASVVLDDGEDVSPDLRHAVQTVKTIVENTVRQQPGVMLSREELDKARRALLSTDQPSAATPVEHEAIDALKLAMR